MQVAYKKNLSSFFFLIVNLLDFQVDNLFFLMLHCYKNFTRKVTS